MNKARLVLASYKRSWITVATKTCLTCIRRRTASKCAVGDFLSRRAILLRKLKVILVKTRARTQWLIYKKPWFILCFLSKPFRCSFVPESMELRAVRQRRSEILFRFHCQTVQSSQICKLPRKWKHLPNRGGLSSQMYRFVICSCASVSERVFMQYLSYENEFNILENEPLCGAYLHIP